MRGAREYAQLFSSGQYGKLKIVSGKHARGYEFSISIRREGIEVEVYGMLGGLRGWTEYYGWIHKGAWVQDFEKLVEQRKSEIELQKQNNLKQEQEKERNKKKEEQAILDSY